VEIVAVDRQQETTKTAEYPRRGFVVKEKNRKVGREREDVRPEGGGMQR